MVGIRTYTMVAAKIISAKFIPCEVWVKRVGTFGLVLYQ